MDHTGSTFPDYHPHASIGEFPPGQADQYEGQDLPGVTDQSITLNSVEFSGKDGNKVQIPLNGSAPNAGGVSQQPQSAPQNPINTDGSPETPVSDGLVAQGTGQQQPAASEPRKIDAKTRLKPAEWREVLHESIAALQQMSPDDPGFHDHFSNMWRAANEVDFKTASKLQRKHNVNNTSPYSSTEMVQHYAEAFGEKPGTAATPSSPPPTAPGLSPEELLANSLREKQLAGKKLTAKEQSLVLEQKIRDIQKELESRRAQNGTNPPINGLPVNPPSVPEGGVGTGQTTPVPSGLKCCGRVI